MVAYELQLDHEGVEASSLGLRARMGDGRGPRSRPGAKHLVGHSSVDVEETDPARRAPAGLVLGEESRILRLTSAVGRGHAGGVVDEGGIDAFPPDASMDPRPGGDARLQTSAITRARTDGGVEPRHRSALSPTSALIPMKHSTNVRCSRTKKIHAGGEISPGFLPRRRPHGPFVNLRWRPVSFFLRLVDGRSSWRSLTHPASR